MSARSDGSNTGGGFPLDLTVETSVDGTTWTPVISATELPRPGTPAQVFSFPVTTARYVQVRGTHLRPDGDGGHRMQLAEMEVR